MHTNSYTGPRLHVLIFEFVICFTNLAVLSPPNFRIPLKKLENSSDFHKIPLNLSFLELALLYIFGSSDFTEKIVRISDLANILLPWIPEPSVNNKLKRREGSGSTGGFFD
jgi:hypothetical protein